MLHACSYNKTDEITILILMLRYFMKTRCSRNVPQPADMSARFPSRCARAAACRAPHRACASRNVRFPITLRRSTASTACRASGANRRPVPFTLRRSASVFHPLFRFEMVAPFANEHPVAQKKYLAAADFRDESSITYLVEDDALNILKALLKPAGATPPRWTVQIELQ